MNNDGHIIILHISDLHRTPTCRLSNVDLWNPLERDILHGFLRDNTNLDNAEPHLPSTDQIDIIVVSGDVTHSASREEYDEAEAFLQLLVTSLLNGDPSRLIVVPGNHDIDWDRCRGAYRKVFAPTADQLVDASLHESAFRFQDTTNPLSRELVQRVRQDLYDERLLGFAQLVNRFYDNPSLVFPLNDRAHQYLIFDSFTERLGIVVVAFNSCDNSDHLWRRGAINREAIFNASQELDQKYDPVHGPLRIAVWHHNVLGSPSRLDFLEPATILLLAAQDFGLGLHGHVHQAGHMDLLGSHARIPVVSAGSLAAGSSERPASIPYLYNIVGIDLLRREGWVHVRARNDERDSWSGFHAFGPQHRCWYSLKLPPRHGTSETHWTYRNVNDPALAKILDSLARQANHITVISPAAFIVRDNLHDIILQRVRRGTLSLSLCYGNPRSPHVQSRLAEEERGEVRPDIGPEGISRRIRNIVEETRGLGEVEIRLFNNYPTMCIMRFDDLYVYYPLGYKTLGNRCPAMLEPAASILGGFLRLMEKLYLDDSVHVDEQSYEGT